MIILELQLVFYTSRDSIPGVIHNNNLWEKAGGTQKNLAAKGGSWRFIDFTRIIKRCLYEPFIVSKYIDS